MFLHASLCLNVAFIPYIRASDPDLSTTVEALKVLDSCGSDIIHLVVPYFDPLADGQSSRLYSANHHPLFKH